MDATALPAAPAARRARVWLVAGLVTLLLAVLAVAAVDRASRWWARQAEARAHETERMRAHMLAEATAAVLNQHLAPAHGVAVSFARGEDVRLLLAALARGEGTDRPELRTRQQALDRRLDIAVQELALGLIAVADRDGVVVAAGEPPGIPSFVGNRYGGGPLHLQTRQGRPARLFLVGETTGRRSIVFAEPVMVEGRFVGYVGVSVTLDEGLLPATADQVLVSDEHGVIVLSRDPRRLFHRLVHEPVWTPPPSGERWPLYGNHPPRLWPWQPGPRPGLWWIDDPAHSTPVLEARGMVLDGLLEVHVLQPATWLQEVAAQRRLLFGLGAALAVALLAVLMLLAAALWQARAHRAALAAANRELQRLVITDPLTGIANRRHLLQMLEEEWRRVRRHGRPLSLLSLDLDHFKAVNDAHGHAEGDRVLRHFAETVQRQLRATDRFGRLGGEEFLVILPETGREAAQQVAWKLRHAVAQTPLPAADGAPGLTVTVSIGGVTSSDPDEPLQALLGRADAALYAAKRAGRDCVRWADDPDVTSPPAG